jgi:nicotinamide-nucleotide amidase
VEVEGWSDEALADAVADKLRDRHVATAESITAGRVANALACVESASEFFRGGLVAYEEGCKRQLLGVTARHVVSAEAAAEMVTGAARLFDVTAAVSTTGLATDEPCDGVPGRTVYIGTLVDNDVRVRHHRFAGPTPIDVREQARRQALMDLYRHLEDRALRDDNFARSSEGRPGR